MLAGPFDPKLSHFAGQRVPVNAQLRRGLRQVTVGIGQRPFDESPLEFAAAVLEADAAIHHLIHQPQQQFAHGSVPTPVGRP
jgi:hypothetical protein